MPCFETDLAQEQILASYLDQIYGELGFKFERNTDLKKQLKGIDMCIIHGDCEYLIDEKSQLHYLNKDLPTFTFELSYLKNGEARQGWLFDPSKKTDFYFLVTAIRLQKSLTKLTKESDIRSLKITSVNRKKLLHLLGTRGLSEDSLNHFDEQIRATDHFGKNTLDRLNSKTEGLLYYTEHLEEKPINLQLRLSFLIDSDVAKEIFPIRS